MNMKTHSQPSRSSESGLEGSSMEVRMLGVCDALNSIPGTKKAGGEGVEGEEREEENFNSNKEMHTVW
jgi:hypothetical protein